MTRLYTEDVELYDIAFTWDLTDEVDWLLERFGPECRMVLEPGSGTGRMLEALARRGLEVVGIDSSPAMVEYAGLRATDAEIIEADMTDFALGRTFDGAVCPINTLSHLTPAQLDRHLDCMTRHLESGARYLVQVGAFASPELPPPNDWTAERGDVALAVTWEPVERDLEGGREEHRSRIEITAGPRSGDVIEETHVMTAWTPASWQAAIAASPFTEVATYDGGVRARPRVGPEHEGGLLWHELVAP